MRVVDSQKNAQVFKALYTFLRESMNFIDAPVSEVKNSVVDVKARFSE